ncbi:ISL3 family transposase (plasmid) [Burkholderia sp. JSH-S8]|nr:ISL3 family transposase [Burkholderia sp. JSH-S8]
MTQHQFGHDKRRLLTGCFSMSEHTLYTQLLKLSSPWQVWSVTPDELENALIVRIGMRANARLACPQCGRRCPRYDARSRQWRHLDTCEYRTIIQADVPRIECPEHGCVTVPVTWAEPGSRYTGAFEMYVLDWLQEASIQAVSRQLRLSWNAIDGIMQRAVKRGLARRPPTPSKHLGVDEVSFSGKQEYITLVSDEHRILAVEDGRDADSLSRYLVKLSKNQRKRIATLTMDMNPAYLKAAFEHLPDAKEKVAFDHFHIAQSLGEALNQTRKRELHRVDFGLRKTIHRMRYHWLRRASRLSADERAQLEALSASLIETAIVWSFKERARDLWHKPFTSHTGAKWRRWAKAAREAAIPALTRVANQIENRLWGIVNAIRERVSNARAEGLNSQIRVMRVKACGYRNKERFKTAILFRYGKLDLNIY